MAESNTPSGAEQLRIVKALLHNKNGQEDYRYLVSAFWIFKWEHHVTHFDELVYNPGKLTMHGETCSSVEFRQLGGMNSKTWFTNMWVHETIWCKWVQWYGIDDGHELDRVKLLSSQSKGMEISLKGDMGRYVETYKLFCGDEKCGYVELQLRRIFGVTHDTETQLWLHGIKVRNPPEYVKASHLALPLVADRSKALNDYNTNLVRYDTVF